MQLRRIAWVRRRASRELPVLMMVMVGVRVMRVRKVTQGLHWVLVLEKKVVWELMKMVKVKVLGKVRIHLPLKDGDAVLVKVLVQVRHNR